MSQDRIKLREFYTILDDCGESQPPLWKKISDNLCSSKERDANNSEMKIFTALEIQRFSPHCYYDIGVEIVVFLEQRRIRVRDIHDGIKEKLIHRIDLINYLEPFIEYACISELSEDEQDPFKVMIGSCHSGDDDWKIFCSHVVKLEDHQVKKLGQIKNLQRNSSPSEEMVTRMTQRKPEMPLYAFHRVLYGASKKAANLIEDHVAKLLDDHLRGVK